VSVKRSHKEHGIFAWPSSDGDIESSVRGEVNVTQRLTILRG